MVNRSSFNTDCTNSSTFLAVQFPRLLVRLALLLGADHLLDLLACRRVSVDTPSCSCVNKGKRCRSAASFAGLDWRRENESSC